MRQGSQLTPQVCYDTHRVEQLGQFRLRKRLATGGMGTVYLAEKIGPEGFVKPVVLKCVLQQLIKDKALVQLFLDEARLAAFLNHQNIAQVFDVGFVANVYYIAMEYVSGYTVDEIRRKHQRLRKFMPLQHIACMASQICQGLHYAHALTDGQGEGLGLVHRDVSPHNLMVSLDGTMKIVDFGLAKARAGLKRVQAKGVVGRFGYMSPEQSRGEVVDGRSDLYSLGVCLWELCTGDRLHDHKLDRPPDYQLQDPIGQLKQHRADVPRQFLSILQRSLAFDKDARFESAHQMHIELERFQAAMTHYAGQAALSKYISNLSQPSKPSSKPENDVDEVDLSGLEGVHRFEEVFGVSMRAPSSLAASPSPLSWQSTSTELEDHLKQPQYFDRAREKLLSLLSRKWVLVGLSAIVIGLALYAVYTIIVLKRL